MRVDSPMVDNADMTRRPSVGRNASDVVIAEAYEVFLQNAGLTHAQAFLDLPGEIVGGHPDRHVLRVCIGGQIAYLKKEHRVRGFDRFRNWWHTGQWGSKAKNEALHLLTLGAAGFPVPRVMAFGENATGQAFVLIDTIPNAVDLRRWLQTDAIPEERAVVAVATGKTLAELHHLGFDHPDLYAKHCLIDMVERRVFLLDWQSARQVPLVSWPRRIRALAMLHASLADHLVPAHERLRFLWAYRRIAVLYQLRTGRDTVPRFAELVRAVRTEASMLIQRRTVREQRQAPIAATAQRLVWLEGESFCAIPELTSYFAKPENRAAIVNSEPERIRILEVAGRQVCLERSRYRMCLGRLLASLRWKSWRSRELRKQRLLFQLERFHIRAPQVLAFGQSCSRWGAIDSFILWEPLPHPQGWQEWFREAAFPVRKHFLAELGALVARLHEAGCLLRDLDRIAVVQGETSWDLALTDVSSLVLRKNLSSAVRRRQIVRIWRQLRCEFRRTEGMRLLRGYLGTSRLNPTQKVFLKPILRELR